MRYTDGVFQIRFPSKHNKVLSERETLQFLSRSASVVEDSSASQVLLPFSPDDLRGNAQHLGGVVRGTGK